jgi:hypothetical protein
MHLLSTLDRQPDLKEFHVPLHQQGLYKADDFLSIATDTFYRCTVEQVPLGKLRLQMSRRSTGKRRLPTHNLGTATCRAQPPLTSKTPAQGHALQPTA